MIDDSKKKHFEYVLVYQLDRFARNRYDSANYKAKLKKNGVRVLSAKENISDDASGILIEGVLESMGALTIEDILLRIGVSALFALAIFVSYRLTHSGSVYSAKFNITLVTLTILTTMVMTVIGNNLALSLGMVGALSIIRFRTSIKDSRDTVYIFWTIIIGICCGVGDFTVAGIGSAVVFIVLLALGRVKNENRILLIIRADRVNDQEIRKIVYAFFTKKPVLKAENTTQEKVELIFELNKKSLEQSNRIETKKALKEKRSHENITDKIYSLGGIDYVNIVVQSDEIS
jgi:uncharacterized membrane protein YhiD involved in acid resistance